MNAFADTSFLYALYRPQPNSHAADALHRAFDILHIATAVHLKAQQFLTFDKNQSILTKVAGLQALP